MSTATPIEQGHTVQPDSTVLETAQSLILAFVLAMTFRGFVTEGFVIPTGSMAPTLMGEHATYQSPHSGAVFPVGLDDSKQPRPATIADAMLGRRYRGTGAGSGPVTRRAGDRILVIKTLYPFFEPDRFDVVVFKNPTEPNGESGNYIKRLIGLPNETIWLVDGDVFVKRPGATQFKIQTKPRHVQRAVWRPISDSDYIPIDPGRIMPPYSSPWLSEEDRWVTEGTRIFRCETAEPTTLFWDNHARRLDDWTPYNQGGREPPTMVVSDLRLRAAIVPEQEGLVTRFELRARSHVFNFILDASTGQARITMAWEVDPQRITGEATGQFDVPAPGTAMNVEFWHVDQMLAIEIDGDRVVEMPYDWSPEERLRRTTGRLGEQTLDEVLRAPALEPTLRWHFQGSPVTLHRVRLDRDLFYHPATLVPESPDHQKNTPKIAGRGFGTHPSHLAVLGPDHFMMLGDNSQSSLDSRLWGSPHPLVAEQIDPAPFVVNRKLLIGKAWVVYFPSMLPVRDSDTNAVPDFGRLRFIR